MLRGRFKGHHEQCLRGIAKMPGFSGSISPDEGLDTGEGACIFSGALMPLVEPCNDAGASSGAIAVECERVELEEEAEEEEEDVALCRDLLDVLNLSLDDANLRA
jgi:hypothetical protein